MVVLPALGIEVRSIYRVIPLISRLEPARAADHAAFGNPTGDRGFGGQRGRGA